MPKKNEVLKDNGPPNGKKEFVFRLYITGASPNSSRAITNLKNIFDKCLPGNYHLEIIDVYQQPQIAQTVDLIAIPLLVKEKPLPRRKLIGDMSDGEKVMNSLGLINESK
jgi:KaiB domain.